MQIPTQCRGLWQGEVISDSKRVKPYPGVICLDADSGDTIYQLPNYRQTGLTRGKLTEPRETDGCLVLDECLYAGAKSWGSRTLSLKLDSEGRLECVWRGKQGYSEGVFTRITDVSVKL